MTKINKSILSLPDLAFFQYCSKQFGINRGVYNTIDEWFFTKQVVDIMCRRTHILLFLTFLKSEVLKHDGQGRLKIGKGNLSNNLENYLSSQNFFSKSK